MRLPVPHRALTVRSWPVALVLALAPLWFVGIVHRGLWTPDEPREADIAWRMSQQSDRTLPQLAGVAFLEKPPLSYWMSAAAIAAFGDTPAAARAPNFLYATVTAISVGVLGYAMGGAAVAFLAGLITTSALIAFRALVWLAPDAALLAGCAIGLAGAFIGFSALPGRRKLSAYTLMHGGAAIGFMAKSAPGWLVPGLALLTLIAWERRWSELRRPEMYAGFIVQALIIGPWVMAVAGTADGRNALLAFFWHNVVGRFTQVSGPADLDYTTGHPNWPGKYFLELPVYLFPWTLLATAAVRRAWRRVRAAGPQGTAWRFAVAAALPFLLLLSLAATARDIYAAPAVMGLGLLIALWAAEIQGSVDGLNRFALAGTRVLIAASMLVFAGFVLTVKAGSPLLNWAIPEVGIVAVATLPLLAAARAQRQGEVARAVQYSYGAYAAMLCVAAFFAFPAIDRWQDLSRLATLVHRENHDRPLALLDPDETTTALMDHWRPADAFAPDAATTGRRPQPLPVLRTRGSNTEQIVGEWFRTQGRAARILVDLPGHAAGPLTDIARRLGPVKAPGDGVAAKLAAQGTAAIVRRYELPQGRRYALLGPP